METAYINLGRKTFFTFKLKRQNKNVKREKLPLKLVWNRNAVTHIYGVRHRLELLGVSLNVRLIYGEPFFTDGEVEWRTRLCTQYYEAEP
jgi:hypothetical protein